jgi:hypothetical protein
VESSLQPQVLELTFQPLGVGSDVFDVAGIGGDAGESQVLKKALKL